MVFIQRHPLKAPSSSSMVRRHRHGSTPNLTTLRGKQNVSGLLKLDFQLYFFPADGRIGRRLAQSACKHACKDSQNFNLKILS
jgi:hypothetical protein